MKIVVFMLLVLTVPIWGPAWVLSKVWKVLALLFLANLLSGCAHNSAKFQKSPCACHYEPANMSSIVVGRGEVHHG